MLRSVISEYGGKGIGRLLRLLIENYAIDCQISFIELQVDCRSTKCGELYNKSSFKKRTRSSTEIKRLALKNLRVYA